jgi:hypothetical protein
MLVVRADVLRAGIAEVFVACGVSREVADIVAEHLVDAELCGVVSHGVIRVPQYVRALEEGQIKAGAQLRLTGESGSTARFDGARRAFRHSRAGGNPDCLFGWQRFRNNARRLPRECWIPAFAGMTVRLQVCFVREVKVLLRHTFSGL